MRGGRGPRSVVVDGGRGGLYWMVQTGDDLYSGYNQPSFGVRGPAPAPLTQRPMRAHCPQGARIPGCSCSVPVSTQPWPGDPRSEAKRYHKTMTCRPNKAFFAAAVPYVSDGVTPPFAPPCVLAV
jgi:hypothetical protein